MTLELDTSLFKLDESLSINQVVFLALIINGNQNNNQDIHEFLSRISEAEINALIDRKLITKASTGNSVTYDVTDVVKTFLTPSKALFDQFYELYPVYVVRPDGTKGFLRANINKCRKEYNRIVGKSTAMHEHLINCLQREISDKMTSGKLGYMKTMWKWLVNREWEVIEEQLNYLNANNNDPITNAGYGNTIL